MARPEQCTAPVTGRHRTNASRVSCPWCGRGAWATAPTPAASIPAAPKHPPGLFDYGSDRAEAKETQSIARLRELAQSDYGAVVEAVARNVRTPPDVLRMIFEGSPTPEDYGRNLAENKSTPPDILDRLSEYEAFQVEVARNPGTSAETLEILADSDIAETKRKTERIDMLRLVARNPNTPIDIVESWVDHTKRRVREGVAHNPGIRLELLERLARDPAATVRRNAAPSARLDPATLEYLADDEANTVRKAVAANPNTPLRTIAILANDKAGVVLDEAIPARERFIDSLGIDRGNLAAREHVRAGAWWEMTADDPDVVLARALFPNT